MLCRKEKYKKVEFVTGDCYLAQLHGFRRALLVSMHGIQQACIGHNVQPPHTKG